MKTVIRGKPGPKVKSAKTPGKKSTKPKATPKAKRSSLSVPESERRRSGRSHNISTYAERGDEEDEKEMLEGVAQWEYGKGGNNDDDDDEGASEQEESGNEDSTDGSEPENDEPEAEAEEAVEEDDEESEPEPPKSNGKKPAAPKSKGKAPAVKASVLAKAKQSTRPTRGRPAKGASDMDVDDDDDDE
jgi:sister-chromatid-cohesion protein PDS5